MRSQQIKVISAHWLLGLASVSLDSSSVAPGSTPLRSAVFSGLKVPAAAGGVEESARVGGRI